MVIEVFDLKCKNMVENNEDWFDAESVKQYLRLRGGQKPQFSALDSSQQVIQNGYVLVAIAEYNVVQFWNVYV